LDQSDEPIKGTRKVNRLRRESAVLRIRGRERLTRWKFFIERLLDFRASIP
jgi:hypothetical protein